MKTAPTDSDTTIDQLIRDPYSIYRTFRAETPVVRVASVNRTMLTKAADTKYVKDNPAVFSSDDPHTPMAKAFQAHTLMRKDGDEHLRMRNAMTGALSPGNITNVWLPIYHEVAEEYVGRLPRGETVDLFSQLAAPVSARCLAHLIGLTDANDDDLCRWSQTLIDGAGNFGWLDEPFEKSDAANIEINRAIEGVAKEQGLRDKPHAIAVMASANNPVGLDVIRSNIKIVIGGGINEPRDALLTALYGLLTNPDQRESVVASGDMWTKAFEEAIRWVAPIQVSSRLVKEETEIHGCAIPKGDVVMTIQASANHDEELYDEPHLFNVHRENSRHQAFGNGPHFCMGTHIARRMIAGILLPMLFDRFPKMNLPEPEKVQFWGFGFRGPLALPVTLN
ncbi:MAG: cytochrome P450 [Rhizobiaceae bacterium]